jgi:hypothetical protein
MRRCPARLVVDWVDCCSALMRSLLSDEPKASSLPTPITVASATPFRSF